MHYELCMNCFPILGNCSSQNMRQVGFGKKHLRLVLFCIWRLDKEANLETCTQSAATALRFIIDAGMGMPNVTTLLLLVCALPVTSNEAERSFSRLKFLKSVLRSTMGNSRYVVKLLHSSDEHYFLFGVSWKYVRDMYMLVLKDFIDINSLLF